MDHRVFNLRTDDNACVCSQRCTDTIEKPALQVDSGRIIPCHTTKLNLHQQHAGQMPHQLSYIYSRIPHTGTVHNIFNMTNLTLKALSALTDNPTNAHNRDHYGAVTNCHTVFTLQYASTLTKNGYNKSTPTPSIC